MQGKDSIIKQNRAAIIIACPVDWKLWKNPLKSEILFSLEISMEVNDLGVQVGFIKICKNKVWISDKGKELRIYLFLKIYVLSIFFHFPTIFETFPDLFVVGSGDLVLHIRRWAIVSAGFLWGFLSFPATSQIGIVRRTASRMFLGTSASRLGQNPDMQRFMDMKNNRENALWY